MSGKDVAVTPMLHIDGRIGWLISAALWTLLVACNLLRIVDPVRARRLEVKYWWRFLPGTMLPSDLDYESLAKSRSRRIRERINAIVFLAFLIAVAYAISTLIRE